jgi:protein-disulfide isomerase
LPQLEQNYVATGKVVYIFYQLPLASIHPNAQVAAEASECAGQQGKFWEMHDQLFGNQAEWTTSTDALTILLSYGAKLGLDQTAYTACLNGHQMASKIQSNSAFAASLGITGTPFFVINQAGKLYAVNGAQPYANFQQGLDGLLANP